MAWNGIGTFTPPAAPEFPAVAGELIRAEYYNAVIQALCAGFSNTLPRDGQAPATGDINMDDAYTVANLRAAVANGEAVRYEQLVGVSDALADFIAFLATNPAAATIGTANGSTLQSRLDTPVFSNIAKGTKLGPMFTEYHNTTPGNVGVRVAVGMLGNPEANLSINMDYTTGVHKYYDASEAAMWLAMGPDNFAMQRAETGAAPGDDIWTATGSKYLFGGNYLGRFFINSYLGDDFGDAQLYVRRNTDKASIGGDGDLVLEGSRINGASAPVLINAYNTGNVFAATGGGKVSLRTLNAENEVEVAVTSADGLSGTDGVCVSDGAGTRMGLNFGVHTGGTYGWVQASKESVGAKNLILQPLGGKTAVGTAAPLNIFEVKVATADGTNGSDGICIGDGAASGRVALVMGVNTASTYGWIQASQGGVGYKDVALQPMGGSLLVGSSTAAPAAKLAVVSTTQGILFPKMTTTQKNAISSPPSGLVVYDTTLNKLCVRVAAAWETITSV